LARVVTKIETACGGSVDQMTIGVWGLTFKANTDDRRESPAMQIAHRLLALGSNVQVFDPTVAVCTHDLDRGPDDLHGLVVCSDAYGAATGASAVAVLTEWDEFRWLDFRRVRGLMVTPSIVDARNLLDPAAVRRLGFVYQGTGRRESGLLGYRRSVDRLKSA
jgi:UDPglucose 6-dehydrogenase